MKPYNSKPKRPIISDEQTKILIEKLTTLLPMTEDQIINRAIERYYFHHLNKYPETVRITRTQLNLKQDYRCFYCLIKMKSNESTVDHLIPLARGGTWNMDNLVASCNNCNQMKGSMTVSEFNKFKKINTL